MAGRCSLTKNAVSGGFIRARFQPRADGPKFDFAYTARWVFEALLVVMQRVLYTMLDHEFDAASNNAGLWNGYWSVSDAVFTIRSGRDISPPESLSNASRFAAMRTWL